MKKLKTLINEMGFAYEREEKVIEAIELIFSVVASRDFHGMRKLTKTKLGSAFLDIAEEYGANTECTMADWHWYEDESGKIVRYSRPFVNPDRESKKIYERLKKAEPERMAEFEEMWENPESFPQRNKSK